MSFPTPGGDAVEGSLMREPQVCLGPAFAQATYQFNLTGTSTPANVYQDGNLTTPFAPTGLVGADSAGRFPPIYLDPSIIYAVTFTSPNGVTWTRDPYVSPLSTRGTSQNTSYGMQIAPTGEVTIPAPNAGGSAINLVLNSGVLGTAALKMTGVVAGNPVIIVNSSATTGVQTASFVATNKPGTATSSPAGWLPVQCDGVVYYVPIWHGNNFTPYVANPTAVGETIAAASVVFGGNGVTTPTSGTAIPGNWFTPTSANIGASYYIKITRTGGLSGLHFSAAEGSFTNITSGGLTIAQNTPSFATVSGTYQLSPSASGNPVVASGTIALTGTTGITNTNWNVATPLVFNTNGTATGNGVSTTNWYSPTTTSIGNNYWISVTQTGGTAGYTFSGVSTNPAAPSAMSGALTLSISGPVGQLFTVNGTYAISTDSGGVNVVGTGTITLTGGTLVQSNNYTVSSGGSFTLNGNGSTSLGTSQGTSWYYPNAANVGSGYYIDITRTGGTGGVNFSAAQGSYTNITNSGLTIGLSGTSGLVGSATASGTYVISNSIGGTTLGSGSISITITGLTITHVYTSGSSATETIPTGSTNVDIEVWAAGGGGGNGSSGCSAQSGLAGGTGSYGTKTYAVSALGGVGKTFKYTIGVGGSGDGVNGTASQVIAGTVTGFTSILTNPGFGASNHTGGAGGAAGSGGSTNAAGTANSTTGHSGTHGGPYGGGGSGGHLNGGVGGAGQSGGAVFFYS